MKIDIHHLAQLANIKLTKTEKEKYQKQLEEILDYVEQLQQVETSSIESTSKVIKNQNITFKDGDAKKQTLKSLKNLKAGKRNYFGLERVKWE